MARNVKSYGLEHDSTILDDRLRMKSARVQAESQEVNLNNVVSDEVLVDPDTVEEYAKSRRWESKPIRVVTVLGAPPVIVDGAHRASAALSRGETRVRASVVDLGIGF